MVRRLWVWLNLCVLALRARRLAGVLGVVVLAAVMWVVPAVAQVPAGPAVSVKGGVLVDVDTGVQLWGYDSGVGRPMGSIAKVMTALLVLRAGDLNQKITVTEAAVKYAEKDGASSAGLIAGDVLTAQQLLEAMLIPSGCDAAYLLATTYGPGRTTFIAEMNAMAAQLGMTSTHFTSFDGMPYPTEHSTWSSPADLVRLGEQVMNYPVFRQIVAQKQYVLPAGNGHHRYKWVQTNKLIGSYAGATGIKTGDTDAAGNCLLFEATRNGVTLMGVVLHANPSSNAGSAITAGAAVLNWGFSQFQTTVPAGVRVDALPWHL
jgi:serine-type D-Ala-D-Ala carboxypeptidase (penicillin-binding protein 5/6)